VTLTASLPSPQVVGTEVVFTANTAVGSPCQYRFWVWVGGTATLVQDWGSGRSWAMPSTLTAASYIVQADVRMSAAGYSDPLAGRDAYGKLAYQLVRKPATSVALTSDLRSPQYAETTIVFTAAGSGSAGYEYRFWLWRDGAATLVRNWSTEPAWAMAGMPAGTYGIQADVRTSALIVTDTVAGRDAYTRVWYSLANPPATGVTVTSDLTSPQHPGVPVTFTASGVGSTAYEYRYWLWAGGVATLVRDWNSDPTWQLSAGVGSYVVQADVRTSSILSRDPVAGRDAYVKMPFTVAETPLAAKGP
jgi:hypothetical protein